VERPGSYGLDELPRMATAEALRTGVVCPDGPIGTQGVAFDGVSLDALISEAGPLPGARFALIHAGEYVAAFKLDSVERRDGVLAYMGNGAPLAWEDGGPVRLVAEKGACFDSVKWVERVEISDSEGAASALDLVKARRKAHMEAAAKG